MKSLPAFSIRIWQTAFLVVFFVVCYLVGLRGWRFAAVFASTAVGLLFFALVYERMIQGVMRALSGK